MTLNPVEKFCVKAISSRGNECGPKWTVQKGESGRSRESGRSVQK